MNLTQSNITSRTCTECGKALKGRQKKYCSPKCKRRAWLRDPEHRAEDRKHALNWKRRNPDVTKAYDREYVAREEVRGRCERCGELLGKSKSGHKLCWTCHTAAKEARWDALEALWADGLLLKEIAAELGLSMGHVQIEMHRARQAGRNLPYRYVMKDGKRVAAA